MKEAEEKLAKEKEMQFKHQQLTNEEKQGLERFKYVKGLSGIGEPSIVYPQLSFKPCCLFAIGSPIGLFLTIRYDYISSCYYFNIITEEFNLLDQTIVCLPAHLYLIYFILLVYLIISFIACV